MGVKNSYKKEMKSVLCASKSVILKGGILFKMVLAWRGWDKKYCLNGFKCRLKKHVRHDKRQECHLDPPQSPFQLCDSYISVLPVGRDNQLCQDSPFLLLQLGKEGRVTGYKATAPPPHNVQISV